MLKTEGRGREEGARGRGRGRGAETSKFDWGFKARSIYPVPSFRLINSSRTPAAVPNDDVTILLGAGASRSRPLLAETLIFDGRVVSLDRETLFPNGARPGRDAIDRGKVKNTRIERKGKKEIQGRNDHARLIRDVVPYICISRVDRFPDRYGMMNIKVGEDWNVANILFCYNWKLNAKYCTLDCTLHLECHHLKCHI